MDGLLCPGHVSVVAGANSFAFLPAEFGLPCVVVGFMPTDVTKLNGEIHGRGLTLLGAFVPVALKDPKTHAAGEEVALVRERLDQLEGASDLEEWQGREPVPEDLIPPKGN